MKRSVGFAKPWRYRSALRTLAVVGAWLVAASLAAAADGHPPVSLDVARCVPADAQQVRPLATRGRAQLLAEDRTERADTVQQ